MAQIQMTEALSSALILRFQAEYGQQAVSNFALDILLDAANAQIAALLADVVRKDELIAALGERIKVSEGQLEDLKQSIDPKRAKVMGAAETVKKRQAHGTNPHTE